MGLFHKKHKCPIMARDNFTDEELGIVESPKEVEVKEIEKKQRELSDLWHNEKAVFAKKQLDIITDDIVRRRRRESVAT